MAVKRKPGQLRKKRKEIIPHVKTYIHSTYNNTIITITRDNGDVLLWKSAGTVGYKGTRKSTPYAAQKAAEECIAELKNFQTKSMDIRWKKTGPGKDSAIKAFQSSNFEVKSIADVTKRTHSISTKKKKRR